MPKIMTKIAETEAINSLDKAFLKIFNLNAPLLNQVKTLDNAVISASILRKQPPNDATLWLNIANCIEMTQR